ncbi:PhzF family phenazine biosynthesis protein [Aquicella lusitana]|uniref:PhzF family phenazine biosynthesis protein n=1 Tax=Aquicella lusitana TaxID=254246 RepID=A0A370GE23_9COXI|nr:PhzF family phenazine biosynthesis protein [Aquicella lusitana]RDI42048.1 PhzF family phenazine biosynthesis protein [Aquicella lusitana]VVC74444.1 putative isomerase YddE [Aquicella lusitana]
MKINAYHIDAFTDKLFSGNPAMVCVLEAWLPEEVLQKIAAENNLPATAFLVRTQDGFDIRWFAPEYEIDLCGHGTLASGFAVFNLIEPDWQEVNFYHRSAGLLRISRHQTEIVLNFPVKNTVACELPAILVEGLGMKPKETHQFNKERLLAVLETEEDVRQLKPDLSLLKQLAHRGIIVTAPGKTVDFVSRVFYPGKAISEDPVTGSSYCLLVPYWARQLNKTQFQARQLSQRGGEVRCELHSDHIRLYGKAILYKEGVLFLD